MKRNHRLAYLRFSAMGLWVIFVAIAGLTGCTYGPVHTAVELGNAVAQPGSHTFAMASIWKRVRDPEGFLATFPDGGKQKTIELEARVYVIDVARRSVVRVAQIPGFAGIPNPKSVHIEGWNGGDLYFRLFGYGGSDRQGDNMSDPRRLFFRVSSGGHVDRVEHLPDRLQSAAQSGPTGNPPFLRLSRGHAEIDIGIDGRPGSSTHRARVAIDPETGEPKFDATP
jgi:hypothetical protein